MKRILGLIIGLAMLLPVWSWGHALHPASIDRHADITLTPTKLVLVYEVVLGINATEKAARMLDPNNDGEITNEDREKFLQEVSAQHASAHDILLASQPLKLEYHMGDAYSTSGHNGIYAIKVDLGYVAEIPAAIPRGVTIPFSYYDKALTQVPGWKQVSFNPLDGVSYSGHIPYRGYTKFDYEILNTRGFAPSTDLIRLEVQIPERADIQAQPTLELPPRMVAMDIMQGIAVSEEDVQSESGVLYLVASGFLICIVALGGLVFWVQRR
ncbi:MAG: hypothetical protein ACOX5R_22385 [bacterium]|jgi:hypothetical protein